MIMTPALIGQIANWIALGISAAPKVEEAVRAAITFINNLFGSGLIDKATQDALMKYVDDTTLAFIKGEPPVAWTVEPDPVTTPPAPPAP